MVLVLVDAITPRLTYTFDFIFGERGVSYELTTSHFDFEERDVSYRLNYSERTSSIARHIVPSTLLRESQLRNVAIDKGLFEEEECLEFDGIADPVASVFYVLSRYEEYGLPEIDEHGRYKAVNSVQVRYNWIEKVVCDRWSKAIIEFIFPELYIESELRYHLIHPTMIVPTFDIDNAFAYKHKAGGRVFMSIMKDLLNLNFQRIRERISVSGGADDPYDTYGKIEDVGSKYEQTRVFWLVRSNGDKDRNVPIQNKAHQETIKRISKVATLGIHPSYSSEGNVGEIENEIKDLEGVLGSKINCSRFHYLKFRLPKYYQALVANGIEEDHSMGYAEKIGFRAGTSRHFKWFDLEQNVVTKLWIHPFAYMDGTLNEYMGLTADQASEKISELYHEVKKYGGDFRFIWHNETINNKGKWNGWLKVLDHSLTLKNG